MKTLERMMAFGADLLAGGTSFRLYAPDHASVSVEVDGRAVPLKPEGDGWWSALVPGVRAGARYGYRFPGVDRLVPDIASRSQPDGPEGLSAVLDPADFSWSDQEWRGIALQDAVIQEIHLGTFTPEGTLDAAAARLPLLAEVGINVVELMPVNDFCGRFGWGYDGVGWFAPNRIYGGPEALRRFVDRAHGLGMAVLMDVVYNHLGPKGQVHRLYGPSYFSTRYKNEWGDPLNFDDQGADGMRALVIENAGFWIREYHLDGLRFDATQQIFDASERHVVAEAAASARRNARNRQLILVAESTPQDPKVISPANEKGQDLDGIWNEDFQRAARIAVTGECDAYYSDLTGSAFELVGGLRHGFLYQGQTSGWEKAPRGGDVTGVPLHRFVAFLENHDQVANSLTGRRLVTLGDGKLLRAATALLLLGPETPMLFQGQEFGASSPFVFFCDFSGDLAEAVRKGRQDFLSQFPCVAHDRIMDPVSEETLAACRLDWSERERNAGWLALTRDLIALRRSDPVLSRRGEATLDMSVPFPEIATLRYRHAAGDRLIVLNTGIDRHTSTLPDPQFAPPPGSSWTMLFSSDDKAYGGRGRVPACHDKGWSLPGRSAVLLAG